jgi:SAM-dependent methyltransferase
MTLPGPGLFTSVFEDPTSAVEARIWTEAYGEEYPAELEPYSFTTRSELRRVAEELALSRDDLLIDVGCGRGGPGLWVASTAGASVLGVDISLTALEAARQRAVALGVGDSAAYSEGSFDAIPADNASARGVMSIDALLFAPDKGVAAARSREGWCAADGSWRRRGITTPSRSTGLPRSTTTVRT